MRARVAALAIALGVSGCFGSTANDPPSADRVDAVLYTIGISTDPYGVSRPNGFGVVSGLASGGLRKAEVRSRKYGWFSGAEWLDRGRILVHRRAPPMRRPALYRVVDGKLERAGLAPFVSGSAYAWSPDQRLAIEPPAPCEPRQASLFECYRGSGRISVTGPSQRIELKGTGPDWRRDGRLVFYRTQGDLDRGRAIILDIATGHTERRARYWLNEEPLASPDGRYLADRTGIPNGSGVVISDANGQTVRTFPTPYIVSTVAWSPRSDRLAYTTSGFPDPHELFLIDLPGGERRRIFVSGAPHFDWITWSPDGKWLLLDGDQAGGWRLFFAATGEQVRRFPRLGGRPLWCCPVNKYDALTGRLE